MPPKSKARASVSNIVTGKTNLSVNLVTSRRYRQVTTDSKQVDPNTTASHKSIPTKTAVDKGLHNPKQYTTMRTMITKPKTKAGTAKAKVHRPTKTTAATSKPTRAQAKSVTKLH